MKAVTLSCCSFFLGLFSRLSERVRVAKARGVLWSYFEPWGGVPVISKALRGKGGVYHHFFDVVKWPEARPACCEWRGAGGGG